MMIRKLESIIEPAVSALGYELWGCEWAVGRSSPRVLRVYVDSQNGVDVDICAKISRQISAVLDVEDLITSSYILEVSSPGIDRPLFKLAQCQPYLGEKIEIRLRASQEGRRNFKGILKSIKDDHIVLQMDNQSLVELAWNDIEKACLKRGFV